jgi:transcriptional regulator with XRE-family HTH domain
VKQGHGRGQILRAWRESQQPVVKLLPLAKRLGCDPSYLRRFEIGEGDLSVPITTALSQETRIPIEILLSAKQLETIRGAAQLLGVSSARSRSSPAPPKPSVVAGGSAKGAEQKGAA